MLASAALSPAGSGARPPLAAAATSAALCGSPASSRAGSNSVNDAAEPSSPPIICLRTRLEYGPPSLASSSACVPCSSRRPFEKTDMASLSMTVASLCATTMVVRPSCSVSSASCTSASDSASRALVASSRSSTRGDRMMARAIAMRCFCPPLSCVPRSPTRVS
mmetsp:Transcript_2417/g.9619  ORF Transcript_2417/g.9619 Transcript_2417/m.9619 type:complete len:164 (+) Transcript_2417:783-1274(+)